MKVKALIFLVLISFCGGSTELVSTEETTTTSNTTMPVELTWDEMYEVCTNEINLNNIIMFKKKFKSLAGYSDHSPSVIDSIVAVANGAKIKALLTPKQKPRQKRSKKTYNLL